MADATYKVKSGIVPRRLNWNGKVIAVGGDVKVKRTPPKTDENIKAVADQGTLKALYEAGYTHLIEKA